MLSHLLILMSSMQFVGWGGRGVMVTLNDLDYKYSFDKNDQLRKI